MTIWFIGLLLCAVLAAAIILPIVSKRNIAAPSGQTLAASLAAIDRDAAAGLIGAAEANEAKVEIKRAALAREGEAPTRVSKSGRLAAFAVAGLAPLAAIAIYVAVGSPQLIGATPPPPGPASIAEMAPDQQQAAIAGMVAGLAARLAANPEDAEGWRMLARSYGVLGDQAKAAGAWRELLARVAGDAEDWRAFAGALMAQGPGEGRETDLARAMATLKSFNPDDPMALYHEGLEARAKGNPATAMRLWTRLLDVLPADAPVRPAIEKLIAEAQSASQKP